MDKRIEEYESERQQLREKVATVGDMRRGSVVETFRRCGKKTCACAAEGHPGHGPYYLWTMKLAGKTKALHLPKGPLLEKVEREVENYGQFRALCDRLIEVSEAICAARPIGAEEQKKKARLPPHGKSKSAKKSKR